MAFNRVCSLFCSAPVLAAPWLDRAFQYEVDASRVGAGTVLMQEDDRDIGRLVCFFSREFNSYQLNYSAIEGSARSYMGATAL